MAHFYLSDQATGASVGDQIAVSGQEARHAITVGRLRVGEQLRVGDGAGTVLHGVVTSVSAERFELTVESSAIVPRPQPAIWLAQALAKGDRDELAIQAATELGVDGVIPWAAERSIVRWVGAKVARQHARWESILREASKQAVLARIPQLGELSSTAQLAELGGRFHLVVLEPEAAGALSELKSDGRDILLVVGPEGGVSPAERTRLLAAGASEARLGHSVLRTSTAGPAAIAVLSVALSRW